MINDGLIAAGSLLGASDNGDTRFITANLKDRAAIETVDVGQVNAQKGGGEVATGSSVGILQHNVRLSLDASGNINPVSTRSLSPRSREDLWIAEEEQLAALRLKSARSKS